MKRILSVQDISCIGRCSQTVALPVISAMGCRCDILPTAILSTHTAFPDPHRRSLTEDIAPTVSHWKSIGAQFDAILVGYLSDETQVSAVQTLFDSFPALRILDPAMGDGGKLYSGITEAQADGMKRLCASAHILLPNITEAAYLTGLPYREDPDLVYFRELLDGLEVFGAEAVILTGAAPEDRAGFYGRWKGADFAFTTTRQPDCHGTGDLFAAAFAGGLMQLDAVPQAAALAGEFVEKALSETKTRSLYGVEFEQVLPWLHQRLQNQKDSR